MAPGTVRLSVSRAFYDIGDQVYSFLSVFLLIYTGIWQYSCASYGADEKRWRRDTGLLYRLG